VAEDDEAGGDRTATRQLLAAAMEAIQLTQAALHPTSWPAHGRDLDPDLGGDLDATLNLSDVSDPSRQSLHKLLQHQTKERGQRPGGRRSGSGQGGGAEADDASALSANSSVHSLRDAGPPLPPKLKQPPKQSRGRGDERGAVEGSPHLEAPLLVAKLWAAKVRESQGRFEC
jgi:hypothetical protein